MELTKVETTVERRDWTLYSPKTPRGSGYCEDQGVRQYLVKRYYLFGRLIWKRDVDVENVPLNAAIHYDIFGDCEWRSKFSEYMKK